MRAGWWLAIFLMLSGRVWAVYYGETRAEVLQELGKPVSHIMRGNREVLIYPKGARIELENGKVVVILGLEAKEGPESVADVVAPGKKQAEPDEPAGEEDPEPALTPEQQKILAEAEAKLEKEWAEQNAKARAEVEQAISEMEKIYDRSREPPGPPAFDYLGFSVGLVLKWLFMLAALKLTCKYWNADVDWSGLMIAAAADTGVRAVVILIGHIVLQMSSLFYADEAVAAFVLVLVLRKVSTNQSLQQAVTITMTCKVFSVVVGAFVITFLLGMMF